MNPLDIRAFTRFYNDEVLRTGEDDEFLNKDTIGSVLFDAALEADSLMDQ